MVEYPGRNDMRLVLRGNGQVAIKPGAERDGQ